MKSPVCFLVRFKYGIFRNFLLITEHSTNLVAFPPCVAEYPITILSIRPVMRNEEMTAVFTFLDKNIMLDHCDELKAE